MNDCRHRFRLRTLTTYDHRNRRISKTVQRLHSTIAPPHPSSDIASQCSLRSGDMSPPVGIHEWETQETHTFVWDGNNIVLEKVEFANGATRTFEYFWGVDKSGSEQGAGGVEGLLAVSVDGVFYIPCYDHNGNIVLYVSEAGSIAAQYTYDPYGSVIDSYGNLADVFSFGFSTQYHDRETGMVGYQRRFYRPDLGRWLNRDPIEEEGGENLYAFCGNAPILYVDILGESFLDVFNDVVSLVGSALTVVGSAAILTAGSVTGVGIAVGVTGFVIGVDQFVKASYRLGNRLAGAEPAQNSPIQWGYRSAIRHYTGQVNSSAEIVADSIYFAANVGSSCANAVISAKVVVQSVKTYRLMSSYDGLLFHLKDGTPFVPVLQNQVINWQLEGNVSITIMKASGKAVTETLEIGISEYIFIQDPGEYSSKLKGE